MKGIKMVAMVVIVTALASCGVLRNKSKQSEKLEIKESAKVEVKQTESSASNIEVKEKEVDKGIVTTEKETTTKTTKEGSKGKFTIKKGDLKPGENYLPVDSAFKMIKAILDTMANTLTIEVETPAEVTEITVKEKVTEHKDLTKEKDEKKQDTTNKQVATVSQNSRDEKIVKQESESKPNVWAILIDHIGWGIAGVLVIGFVLWYFFRKK